MGDPQHKHILAIRRVIMVARGGKEQQGFSLCRAASELPPTYYCMIKNFGPKRTGALLSAKFLDPISPTLPCCCIPQSLLLACVAV